jgi:hypothetical protein
LPPNKLPPKRGLSNFGPALKAQKMLYWVSLGRAFCALEWSVGGQSAESLNCVLRD